MDAEVMAGLRRSTLPKRKGGKTTGVNRVNSCFPLFLLFSSILFPFLCAPTSIFLLFSLKKFLEKEWHFKYFIYLCTQIAILLTRVDAFFLKREIAEMRTWEGSGIMT